MKEGTTLLRITGFPQLPELLTTLGLFWEGHTEELTVQAVGTELTSRLHFGVKSLGWEEKNTARLVLQGRYGTSKGTLTGLYELSPDQGFFTAEPDSAVLITWLGLSDSILDVLSGLGVNTLAEIEQRRADVETALDPTRLVILRRRLARLKSIMRVYPAYVTPQA